MTSVAVIGGGVTGLATAILLAQRGISVDLFEKNADVGGRAGSVEQDGFRWDTGPSWYLMPEVFERFFARAGTSVDEQLDLVPLHPAYRVFSEGFAPVDVHSGREAALNLVDELEPGSRDTMAAYLDSARDAYDTSLASFLYEDYARPAKILADPGVRTRLPQLAPLLTRTLADHIDRHFDDPRVRQILGYPAVFLGGSPYTVPALYHLMSHLDLGVGVSYPRGGFVQIVRALMALATAAGVNIHTSSPISRIVVNDRRVTGIEDTDGQVRAYDAVLSTTDARHTEDSLLAGHIRRRRRDTPSSGALLLLLGVRGELPQLPHHSLLFTEAWRAGFDAILSPTGTLPDPASIYVCNPSATDPTVAPAGHTNLFVLVPTVADPQSGRGGQDGAGAPLVEETADRIIAQIAQWADIPDLAERIVVRRTVTPQNFAEDLNTYQGNALGLSHTLRQSAMFRRRQTVRGLSGFYRAGADIVPGIGLPMCLIGAELVADRILTDVERGAL